LQQVVVVASTASPTTTAHRTNWSKRPRIFGRTSRVPMLWFYIESDTFFDPALSKRMHEAFTAAGGRAEYHLMPPFGNEGHFFVGSPDAIPMWSPLVEKFLDAQK
jgi:homoserine acetyltransferase